MRRLVLLCCFASVSTHASDWSSVSWLAGTWQGTAQSGGCVEETWTAPRAGLMPGFFRWLKDGQVVVYELIQIRSDSGRWLYELKHFDSALKGWEKRGEVLRFESVPAEAEMLRFRQLSAKKPMELTYRRKGANGLEVVLTDQDGAPTVLQFTRRAAGSPPTGCD